MFPVDFKTYHQHSLRLGLLWERLWISDLEDSSGSLLKTGGLALPWLASYSDVQVFEIKGSSY